MSSFFSELKDLFSAYEKQIYPEYLEKFIDYEDLLNQVLPEHSIHYDHVIQIFLLGFNILTHWDYILEKQENCIDDQEFYCFRNLIFSWIISSLFHDYGYILELIHKHFEELNEKLSYFSDFNVPRFDVSPIHYDLENNHVIENLKYIHQIYQNLPEVTKLDFTEFQNLFLVIKNLKDIDENTTIDTSKYPLDHGIISSINYIKLLSKVEKDYHEDSTRETKIFKMWDPNKYAVISIALHNFKQMKVQELKRLRLIGKEVKLKLSSRNIQTVIPYLLIVCDTIHVWSRNKNSKIKVKINLIYINVFKNQVNLIINHKLRSEHDYSKYFINILKDLKKIKEKLPFIISFRNLGSEIEEIRGLGREIGQIQRNNSILGNPPETNTFILNIEHRIDNKFIFKMKISL